MNAADVARRLYSLGFNVVCTTPDKRPYGSWEAGRRGDGPPQCRENVAVTGNFFAEGGRKVVILDVDNPDTEILAEVFGDDWRQYLCGQPWSFCVLTGARPKGRVRCSDGLCTIYKDEKLAEVEEVVPADRVRRGLAVVLQVDEGCVRGGFSTVRTPDVELIYNNYQVVYGPHPSGVSYQFVRWDGERFVPTDSVGPGVLISCEEFQRLVSRLTRRGEESVDEERYEPPTSWDRRIADAERLVEKMKQWWPVAGADGRRFHDALVFGITSVAWRYGVRKEDVVDMWERVFRWALESGLDADRDVKHHRSVVEWVYKAPPDRRRWGKRKLKDVIYSILSILHGQDVRAELVEAEYDEILSALGVRHRRPEDVSDGLCVVLSRTVVGNVKMPTAWLCNSRFGITYTTVQLKERRRRRRGGEEKGEDEEGKEVVVTYRDTKLCDITIDSLTVYEDVFTGRRYVNAVYTDNKGVTHADVMMSAAGFVEKISRQFQARRSSVEWKLLINYYPHVADVVYSGFFCPPEEGPHAVDVPCRVRDYFDTGIVRAERPQAREALEAVFSFFSRFALSEELYRAYVTAYAHALAQTFHLTRKMWGVRPAFVVFEGPRGAGKSTIARLALTSLHPKRADELFVGAYASMSPARMGRLQSEVVASLIVLDEQKIALARPEVAEVLKSMVTSHVAWRTALGEQWPAYSGIVLTANYLDTVGDPELADKLYKVEFPAGADPSRRAEFAAGLRQIQRIAPYFGGYYLHFAERSWPDVKSAVLASLQVEAAEAYFRVVAEDLGVALPEFVEVQQQVGARLSVRELLYRYVWSHLRPQLPNLGSADSMPLDGAFDRALMLDRLPGIREFNRDYIIVERGVAAELGVNIATLCRELGGEIYRNSRDGRYYGNCVVDKREFMLAVLGRSPADGGEGRD